VAETALRRLSKHEKLTRRPLQAPLAYFLQQSLDLGNQFGTRWRVMLEQEFTLGHVVVEDHSIRSDSVVRPIPAHVKQPLGPVVSHLEQILVEMETPVIAPNVGRVDLMKLGVRDGPPRGDT
jgi:hypothetical protein